MSDSPTAPPENKETPGTPHPVRKRTLNQEDFDCLLTWLDPDRDEAGRRYEQIRRGLIQMFKCRGSLWAEELANETIDRVCRKVKELAPRYVGNPTPYFFDVAKKIYLESLKKKLPPAISYDPQNQAAEDVERRHECLDRCLQKLAPDDRALALDYYREEKQGKIDNRKELARRHEMTLNALRIKMYGIRGTLYKCIRECLGQ